GAVGDPPTVLAAPDHGGHAVLARLQLLDGLAVARRVLDQPQLGRDVQLVGRDLDTVDHERALPADGEVDPDPRLPGHLGVAAGDERLAGGVVPAAWHRVVVAVVEAAHGDDQQRDGDGDDGRRHDLEPGAVGGGGGHRRTAIVARRPPRAVAE